MHDLATAAEVLVGADLAQFRLSARKLAEALPQGKSACTGVEMAMLDAYARSLGIPVYALFGGAAIRIETDVTVAICPPDQRPRARGGDERQGLQAVQGQSGQGRGRGHGARDSDQRRRARAARSCSMRTRAILRAQAVKFTKSVLDRDLKIRLLEQPVDAADLNGTAICHGACEVPVFADEVRADPGGCAGSRALSGRERRQREADESRHDRRADDQLDLPRGQDGPDVRVHAGIPDRAGGVRSRCVRNEHVQRFRSRLGPAGRRSSRSRAAVERNGPVIKLLRRPRTWLRNKRRCA